MKVVHVAGRSSGVINGIQKHILCLAVAQKACGFSPVIVAYEQGHFVDECRRQDIPVIVEEELSPVGSRRFPEETAIKLLAEVFAGVGAELVHCHSEAVAAQAIPAGNRAQIPCVFSHHVGAPMTSLTVATKYMGLKFKTISTSRSGFKFLKKDGFPEEDLYYVTYGIPVAPDSRPQRVQQPNLMMVANLIYRKGLDVAILAMFELRRRHGQDCPSLDIYGGGISRNYFHETVSILGLGDIITFQGTQPGILDTCPGGDIFVMPSRNEAGPIVVLEAMSRGMPIVATNVGDVADMLPDPRYGRVIPTESVAALADAIESLRADIRDGKFDPYLLVERHRELYTSEIMAERIAKVYEQAICA
jgi:glycosyltransferase involved in cell wall biosynthesis